MQPAYNKDDFFDTISCNSLGRGARDGQNRLSERVKMDSEVSLYYVKKPFYFLDNGQFFLVNTYFFSVSFKPQTFGNFQRRTQFGYGGYRAGHGQHRGPYNWGRGSDYGYRGRGRYA